MRFLIAPLALMLMAVAPASAETRALNGFTSVAASGGIQVEVSQGPAFAVTVEGRDADQILTDVHGRWLRISRRGWLNFGRGPDAIVHVTLPQLEALSASSGVGMRAQAIESRQLDVTASQGAQVSAAHVRVGTLSLAATQGATLEIAGACTELGVRASMGGVIDAGGLDCSRADANASMGGTVEIHATDTVNASASMGGTIDVSGQPEHRDAHASMGGQIDFKKG